MKKRIAIHIVFLSVLISFSSIFAQSEQNDPFMWLEEVDGEKSLEWVEAKNKVTVDELSSHPQYEALYSRILGVLNSEEKIAYPKIRGNYFYNLWQDAEHKRGIWRRTSKDEYMKKVTNWEILIDLDELSKEEGEKWAFKGADFLYPDCKKCMINLSRGGSDAVEIREFDLDKKSFVANGFFLSQSKGGTSWIDENTLLISTNFGEGTMTTSGYPRIAKIWKRGTSMDAAQLLLEAEETDMGVWGNVLFTAERKYPYVYKMITFWTSEVMVLEKGKLIKLQIPEDAKFSGILKNQMLIELRSEWRVGGQTYPQGALISIDYDKFLKGDRKFTIIFKPGERSSLADIATTQNTLLLTTLTEVKGELYQYQFINNNWIAEKVNAPEMGSISIKTADDLSDQFFFSYENLLTPVSLYYVANQKTKPKVVKNLPHFFKSKGLTVKQYQVSSKDGTKIPYFIVMSKKAKLNGKNPTLLYAYGGFEIAMEPWYRATTGIAWMEQGGIYVLANIRGGGEFGPKWHQAGLKENRQKVFDDFYAVTQDLIDRNITSPEHLGIMGGSNGGLLVGVAYTQHPELYHAVVCAVPLLDMKRYNKLLAGASWMGEYGNPDIPEEWEYIKKYSPYQNLFKDKEYPKVFFTTTTRDDRVHPGHARKMAAKMEAQGHPFYYFENTEGGHGAGVTNNQRAKMIGLEYVYLLKMLKK